MTNSDNTDPYADLARLQQQLDEQQQRVVNSPSNQPNPPGFDEICRDYVLRDIWTIAEASLLLNACHPKRPVPLPGVTPKVDSAIRKTQEFLIGCLGVSLPVIGSMPKIYKSRARIRVADLHALIKQKSLTVPDTLANALAEQFGALANNEPHGNTVRNQEIRKAACGLADHLVNTQARSFLKQNGRPYIDGLANYLESHPREWVPKHLQRQDGHSPRAQRTLAELLGDHFKKNNK